MSRPRVYLAGPITGVVPRGRATVWRENVAASLLSLGLTPVSPLRADQPLGWGEMTPEHIAYSLRRDRRDVETCDAVLVNFLGAQRVSLGTMLELGWAEAAGKPIVVVMEPGNPHDSPVVRAVAWRTVGSVLGAVEELDTILSR